MRTITTLVLAAVTGLSGLIATDARAAGIADEPVPGRLLLVLDASGSMKAEDPSGLTKIEAAKKALTGVVGALPATAQVGLRVYGATVDGKGRPTPAACADTRLVAPIVAVDKPRLTSTIAAVSALGETPIAHSLEESMKDLGTEGKRNIVLVSDGEESCVPDPCPVVRKLTAAGINLQIDTVGFGVDAKARAQLQCIAGAGNGTYFDAKDADQLATSLSKLSQRALRPFTVSGVPVVGTAAATGAPEIAAGQYTDTLTTGEGRRHYALRRTIPGSTLRVAMTMRPGYSETGNNDETVQMRVESADGTCDNGPANRIGTSDFQHLVTRTLRVAGTSSVENVRADECATAPSLTLSLDRTAGAPTPQPVEILVMEEPPVTDADALPEADRSQATRPAPAAGRAKPVVGGVSFSSAPRITPGTWTETFVPGETIFYRVPVSWGQHIALSVLPTPGSVTDGVRRLVHYNPVIYAPDRRVVGEVGLSSGTFGADKPTSQVSREVRYRNRDVVGISTDLAGDHFVSIAVPRDKGGNASAVPMTFTVTVEGTASGEPSYAATAPSASTSPGASPSGQPSTSPQPSMVARDSQDGDEGSSLLLWVGLGAVALLGAGGTAYRIVRTRQGAQGKPSTS
ncbi:vWA domain-containing protein [Knoellia sp. LjRoot47]|uniref:vWA domain-containing protein n=1 Tax=Knoellia sp. LjRoot47 TaxID=3342330 RepID=UPI003ECD6C92